MTSGKILRRALQEPQRRLWSRRRTGRRRPGCSPFWCGLEDQDSVLDDRAHGDEIALASAIRLTCELKSFAVGAKVAVAPSVSPHFLDLIDDTRMDIFTEVGVLVHSTEDLLAPVLGEVFHAGALLVIVGRKLAEFEFVERRVHRPSTGGREHARTPFSIIIGNTASICGVPPLNSDRKMLSRFTSLFIACTAFGTMYSMSSAISRICAR